MSEPDREIILRRFTAWLDQALAREDTPAGIPAGLLDGTAGPRGGELFAVEAALAALTQEVKLQGRSFKQLGEAVAPVAEMAPALTGAIERAGVQARREVLDTMLDLRDRLLRGQETARSAAASPSRPRRWWQRAESPRTGEVVAALREGYELTLGRLDEALASYGVQEIDCAGQPFDPAVMQAVGIEESASVAEGTVVAVYRRGYEWNGKVHRPADVRVARRPGRTDPSEAGELKEQHNG